MITTNDPVILEHQRVVVRRIESGMERILSGAWKECDDAEVLKIRINELVRLVSQVKRDLED